MAGIEVHQHIEAPPEVVFDAATDFANAAGTISGIVKAEILTEGPVGVGTRFRETRKMMGREATETMEIVEFKRPSHYRLLAESHGCRYLSGLRFEPQANGTKVTMSFDATPLTFVARLMSILMKPMTKLLVKMCAKDLADLKTSIETRVAR